MKRMYIADHVHAQLVRIRGLLEAQTGERKNLVDVLEMIIADYYEKLKREAEEG